MKKITSRNQLKEELAKAETYANLREVLQSTPYELLVDLIKALEDAAQYIGQSFRTQAIHHSAEDVLNNLIDRHGQSARTGNKCYNDSVEEI